MTGLLRHVPNGVRVWFVVLLALATLLTVLACAVASVVILAVQLLGGSPDAAVVGMWAMLGWVAWTVVLILLRNEWREFDRKREQHEARIDEAIGLQLGRGYDLLYRDRDRLGVTRNVLLIANHGLSQLRLDFENHRPVLVPRLRFRQR